MTLMDYACECGVAGYDHPVPDDANAKEVGKRAIELHLAFLKSPHIQSPLCKPLKAIYTRAKAERHGDRWHVKIGAQ